MDHLIEQFCRWWFVVPPVPVGDLPFVARKLGAGAMMARVAELCYREGVKDGAIFGAGSVVILLILALVVGWVIKHAGTGKGLISAISSLF